MHIGARWGGITPVGARQRSSLPAIPRRTIPSTTAGLSRCAHTEVILDPRTFIPRRIEITGSADRCRPGAPVTDRETWTITNVRSLTPTATNRRLLTIGDWPTVRTVQWVGAGRPGKPIDHAPPVPPLDEG